MDEIIRRLNYLCDRIATGIGADEFFFDLGRYVDCIANAQRLITFLNKEANAQLLERYQQFRELIRASREERGEIVLPKTDLSHNRFLRGIREKDRLSLLQPERSLTDGVRFSEQIGDKSHRRKVELFNDKLMDVLTRVGDELGPTDQDDTSSQILSDVLPSPSKPDEITEPAKTEERGSASEDESQETTIKPVKIIKVDFIEKDRTVSVNNGTVVIVFNRRKNSDTEIFKMLCKLWPLHYEVKGEENRRTKGIGLISLYQLCRDCKIPESAINRQIQRLSDRFSDRGLAIAVEVYGANCKLVVNFD